MDGLEVPQPFAGARIDRDQAVREQVLTETVGTVEVVGRRAGGHVDDAALVIYRNRAPVVGAADVLVGLLRPGFVTELSGRRNSVELPHSLAGDDVVRADVSGRGDEGFPGRGPEDQQIPPDFARTVVVPAHLVAAKELGAQIDDPVDAEGGNGEPGAGIDGLQETVDREQQPAFLAVLALPVIDATARHAVESFVDPDLLPGRRVEGDR